MTTAGEAAMKPNKRIPPNGEVRQSQMITTYGPGSMVDLPNESVIIGGLEYWHGDKKRIFEERLEARVQEILNVDEIALYAPPVDGGDPTAPKTGVTAFTFPKWFVAQVEETFTTERGKTYRARPLLPHTQLVKGGFLSKDRKTVPVVPVRFVQACVKGHISDIDWYAFVRDDFRTQRTGQLWLDEGGAGNDFSEIFVRCSKTGLRRPLSDLTVPDVRILGTCSGYMPWLGPGFRETCQERNRLLVRSASNAYFSQNLSVIAIPDAERKLKDAVDKVYDDFLQYAESVEDILRERRKQKVHNALEGFETETVWREVRRRRSGRTPERKTIKQLEIETLLSQPDSIGEDIPDGDFYARTRDLSTLPAEFEDYIERIVLVHRLKEVNAQLGFTRFEAAMPDIDGELSLDVQPAPLARDITWVPAVENKGEGIFLAFKESAIHAWLNRSSVMERGRALESGFDRWKERKKLPDAKFPHLPYIMLHSLSHLLLTTVALECGYSASSIRERIYSGQQGYGILLYTGSTGSEGTLGGLVDIGKNIEHHLKRALEYAELCSNDPICSHHDPVSPHEERFLHGAACHGCLLIAETSCERRNEFLDRALVVPTVSNASAAFFDIRGLK
jgi:hypothetical protein